MVLFVNFEARGNPDPSGQNLGSGYLRNIIILIRNPESSLLPVDGRKLCVVILYFFYICRYWYVVSVQIPVSDLTARFSGQMPSY